MQLRYYGIHTRRSAVRIIEDALTDYLDRAGFPHSVLKDADKP
jgi:hypothetical protein